MTEEQKILIDICKAVAEKHNYKHDADIAVMSWEVNTYYNLFKNSIIEYTLFDADKIYHEFSINEEYKKMVEFVSGMDSREHRKNYIINYFANNTKSPWSLSVRLFEMACENGILEEVKNDRYKKVTK